MQYPITARTRVSRQAHKVFYEQELIDQILDEALYCTLSYAVNGQAYSIPTLHVRIKDQLYIHGSSKSHFLLHMPMDQKVCISVTLLDGLVLAYSAFGHSMNYRSVILFVKPEEVIDANKKLDVLKAMINKVKAGRWEDNIRKPTEGELTATTLFSFRIEEVSAKVRQGPPNDSEADRQIKAWAGHIPIRMKEESPVAEPSALVLPDYLRH